MKSVIANGNDSVDNILLLNVNGYFELFQGIDGETVEHLNYVASWETFDSGNDYEGICF